MRHQLLVALAIAALGWCLPAQSASFEYRGSGCGWFQYPGQDLTVISPPVVGRDVVFNVSIPPYGVDHMSFGTLNPRFPVGWTSPTSGPCRVHAWMFPGPIHVWLAWQSGPSRWVIPNDPALYGYSIYVQQMNTRYGLTYPIWEMSRGVKLTLGY